MDARMLRYYRKQMNGGRSIVARTIDFVIFRLFLAFMLFWLLLFFSRSFTVSILISIFLTIAVSLVLFLINQKRTERFIKKDLKRIKEKCLLETLTFMTFEQFSDYMNKILDGIDNVQPWEKGFTAKKDNVKVYAFHNHPRSNVDVSDILDVLRGNNESLILVSLSAFTENAKRLCESMTEDIALIPGSEVLKLAAKHNMLPDEEEAEQRSKNEMNASLITLEKIKQTTLSKTKIKRYVICGVIVMLWPLMTGFKFYYPIIAAGCFLLAVLAFRKSKQGEESGGMGIS